MATVYGASATAVCAQDANNSSISLAASLGADYSTGDYGAEEKTSVVLVPLIVRARAGDLSVSASLTYIRIDGPADVVIGPDGEQLPGVPAGDGVREGLSDLSLGAGYTFGGEDPMDPQFALSGRVKLPTSKASDQLSTGKLDYSMRGEVSVPMGAFTPFASVGYRFLGDPDGVDLKNGLSASIGASATLDGKVLIASLDYAAASSENSEDSRSLFGGLSIPLSPRLNLTGYGVLGLSESSPDYGVGVLITAQIF
jgi:hypothetical protein